VWPLAARAQQARKIRRIGFVGGGSRAGGGHSGLAEGMASLGYTEGKDFAVEWRFAEGQFERFPALISDLIGLNVDVIVLGTTAAIRPAQKLTTSIPLIMSISTAPVELGFVASLARPGGNTTGLATAYEQRVSKQVELFATAIPGLSRIGVLSNANNPVHPITLKTAYEAAQQANLGVVPLQARTATEIEDAIATFVRERAEGLLLFPDGFFNSRRHEIFDLARKNRLASVVGQREYLEAGALISYGEHFRDFLHRTAVYVDKIFKGAKPGDLPIEQPTRFYLLVNLNTAKALDLKIPESFLVRADEVIEQVWHSCKLLRLLTAGIGTKCGSRFVLVMAAVEGTSDTHQAR
jgi:putative ABC transport system substrate-binding protein